MYCSSCGVEVTKELNYCNRCGANLNAPSLVPQLPAPTVSLTGPTIALGGMVVLSLAAIFSGASNLALRGVHPTALAWIVIMSLAMVFGVAGLVIRLWLTLLSSSAGRRIEPQPAQLRQPQPNPQLQAPQTGPMNVPFSSVTDHTTRTFDPVYRERGK